MYLSTLILGFVSGGLFMFVVAAMVMSGRRDK